MSEAMLRVSGLCKRFRSLQALDRVDLEVNRGEIFALVGESGSGKTVFAEIVAGLQKATVGTVDVRGRVQMVFQNPYESFDPRMTVLSSVMEPLRSRKPEAKRSAEAALAEVGLDPSRYAPRFPHQLSGGELQRASIARALVARPELLIADEPTTMLDVSVRATILRLLRRLRDEHSLTLVLISHDFGGVRAISDRAAVLYRGRVVESGPCSAVLRRPQHPYTAALLAAVPQPDPDRPLRSPARSSGAAIPAGGCPFAPRCPERQPECSDREPRLVNLGDGQAAACLLRSPEEPERPVTVEAGPSRLNGRPRD